MRIQKKMLLISLALIVALILPTGIMFYKYNTTVLLEEAESNLANVAQKLSLQMEGRIQQIDASLLFVMSDPDFLSSIAYHTMPGREDDANRLVMSDSTAAINRLFRSYAISKHFYKMVLFDMEGNYFTSDFRTPTMSPETVYGIAGNLDWLEAASDNKGLLTLLPPAKDPWSDDGEWVYGAARSITTASGKICYLQVQRRTDELEEMLTVHVYDDVCAQLVDRQGKVYCSVGDIPKEEDHIQVASEYNEFGLRAILYARRDSVFSPVGMTGAQIAMLCLLATTVSTIYIFWSTRRLTRPLRALERAMDQTALSNLGSTEVTWEGDELKSLCTAYSHLCQRLNVAVEEKMLAQSLEMQARLDALQAQIDPHFIYNTLNVIMSRALIMEDQETLCLCEGLSEMIRYSTSTEQRMATIGEEADHLENYLCLMKIRYKHRLEFQIDIPDIFHGLTMPKIVLQPIVENSIRHGFSKTGGLMRICVSAMREADRLLIEICDNGSGFEPAVLEHLIEQMDSVRKGSYKPENSAAIGGMGLVNTFARLYYFYGDRFSMILGNRDSGAGITIAIPVEGEVTEC